tara:strand:- start:9843 stop:10556 length:714 start_codon:yes stop_codon:yes gene_type:complete
MLLILDFLNEPSDASCVEFQLNYLDKQYNCVISKSNSLNKELFNADRYLSKEEKNFYVSLSNMYQKDAYLLGRIAAKRAISHLVKIKDLKGFSILNGIFGQPVVSGVNISGIQISISHKNDMAIAVAFFDFTPLAVDLEKIRLGSLEEIKSQLSQSEVNNFAHNDSMATLLWTVKESLSKALKTGLMTNLKIYEISELIRKDHYYICYFRNFPQYKCYSYFFDDMVFSIIFPSNLNI